jgi:hypothetical protein
MGRAVVMVIEFTGFTRPRRIEARGAYVCKIPRLEPLF